MGVKVKHFRWVCVGTLPPVSHYFGLQALFVAIGGEDYKVTYTETNQEWLHTGLFFF